MPPLRERREDIPLLLNELISTMESENRGSVRFNSAAIAALTHYHWPGNVRELANLVERMAILYPHGIVGEKDLPAHLRDSGRREETEGAEPAQGSPAEQDQQQEVAESVPLPLGGLDLKEYLASLEKDLISKALEDSSGVVARAASRLHMRRTTLVEKLRKYNLPKKAEDGAEIESGPEPDDAEDQRAEGWQPAENNGDEREEESENRGAQGSGVTS
jgi:sigma-54 specific flagellar transcriptional regulator A